MLPLHEPAGSYRLPIKIKAQEGIQQEVWDQSEPGPYEDIPTMLNTEAPS